MTDIVDPATRSRMMRSVRRADTKPEVALRRRLHAAGLRYRLDVRALPGSPDIVLPRHRVAIFVHGCYWHRHPGCRRASTPATKTEFWTAKFAANIARDARAEAALLEAGWRVLTVWECGLARAADADAIGESVANEVRSGSRRSVVYPRSPPFPRTT